jgi:hypothetical protein
VTKTEEEAVMLQEQMLLHPDTVQDHEITIVADLGPHEYVKVSEVEEIGTDPVQDHVTDPFSQVLEVQMVQITEKAIETVIIIAGKEFFKTFSISLGSVSVRRAVMHLQPNLKIYNLAFTQDFFMLR